MLEVVYTFPLPHQAVLLGFASELNGARKAGTIVARREAERQYEAALVEGDAPVMLEALEGGLHTANIGNLEPGDEIVPWVGGCRGSVACGRVGDRGLGPRVIWLWVGFVRRSGVSHLSPSRAGAPPGRDHPENMARKVCSVKLRVGARSAPRRLTRRTRSSVRS